VDQDFSFKSLVSFGFRVFWIAFGEIPPLPTNFVNHPEFESLVQLALLIVFKNLLKRFLANPYKTKSED